MSLRPAGGSVGVRRIKEEDGVTLAQESKEAEDAQMPQAAIETGAVAFVMPIAAMPEKLASLHLNAARSQLPIPEEPPRNPDEDALREVRASARTPRLHRLQAFDAAAPRRLYLRFRCFFSKQGYSFFSRL
jgi:hypothetical protein